MAKGRKTGGRSKGTLNKGDGRSAGVLREHRRRPVYQAKLRRRALAGKLSPAMESLLWYYAKGKPKEHVELSRDAELLARLDAGRLRNATRDPQP